MRGALTQMLSRRPRHPLRGLRFSPETLERLTGKTMILGVGAQKAGTSWLHDHLSRQPDVVSTPLKEVHFFDTWLRPDLTRDVSRIMSKAEAASAPGSSLHSAHIARRRMISSPGAYLDLFAEQNLEGARYMIDTSPAYALLGAEDFAVVREYFERAGMGLKAYFIMRDPVDRIVSHEFALRRTRGDAHDPRRTVLKALAKKGWRARSEYQRTVEALSASIPEKDVYFGFYEHLHQGDVERLERWLSLPPLAPKTRRINATRRDVEVSSDVLDAAADTLASTYAFVNERFGAQKPSTWRR